MWNSLIIKVGPIISKRSVSCFNRNLSPIQSLTRDISKPLGPSVARHVQLPYLGSHFCTATSSSASPSNVSRTPSFTSPSRGTKGNSVALDEHSIDELHHEMDRQLLEITNYINNQGRVRQYKNIGLTLVTLVAGVAAGAYAAHFGAWFLEKVGLYIFEEDEDD